MRPRGLPATPAVDLGALERAPLTRRYLSDLRGSFADERAYAEAVKHDDRLVYTVSTVEPASGAGQLQYGLGVLMPGKVGAEFFLTKGHLHAWRAAAEVYIGLRGHGSLLLESERTGRCQLAPLGPNQVVYVPGHTAHRTINTGTEPLVYLGVYPAAAGHDYGPVDRDNFRHVLVEKSGRAVLRSRAGFLRTLRPTR
jgi:glucose-6-phosphate isomerase, archaeal